jgi:hypothetical protein
VASGGSCGSGAAASAVSAGLAPVTNSLFPNAKNDIGQRIGGTIVQATTGGLASVAGGGKFANGAVTGAFGYLVAIGVANDQHRASGNWQNANACLEDACIGEVVGGAAIIHWLMAGATVGAGAYAIYNSEKASSPEDILTPGGVPIGTPNGKDETIRNLPGGQAAADELFGRLSQGGTPTQPNYPGTAVTLPGGGFVGIRSGSASSSGVPAIDVNIPGVGIGKIHFP